MIKHLTFALLFLLGSNTLFSQKFRGYNDDLVEYYTRVINKDAKLASDNSGLSAEELKAIKGSPYEYKQFTLGNLYKNDTLIATELPMRYNIVSDQIELMDTEKLETEPSAALLKDSNVSVEMNGTRYRYNDAFVSEKGITGSYFNVVLEGDGYQLYKKMDIIYQPPFKAQTTFDNDRPAEFIKKEVFYLVTTKGEFTELPTRKSALYKVLGDKKKEVKDYIDKNSLDLDESSDLAKVVAYYNSLQ